MLIRLAMTLLLSKFIPLGAYIGLFVKPLLAGLGLKFGNIFISLLIPTLALVPLFIVAHIFVKNLETNGRILAPKTGSLLILIALICYILIYSAYFFAVTIPGGGPAFAVMQLGSPLAFIANILLIIAVTRYLLALGRPTT